MDYFIYLNGMRVCCYFIDHDYNGNVNESGSYYCLYDGQGNIVQISNKAGDMPYTLFKYDSYGNTLEAETDGDEAESGGYKGYDHGAVYFKTGARHYDPNTGTFISPDPFKGYMGDPQSQHPYMYCAGNPIKYADPSGYWRWESKNGKATLISEQYDTLRMLSIHGFPTAGMTQPRGAGERWNFTYLFQYGIVSGNLNKHIQNYNCAGTAYSWILRWKPPTGTSMHLDPNYISNNLTNRGYCQGSFDFMKMQFGDVVSFGSQNNITHFGIYLSGSRNDDTHILSQWGNNQELKITTLEEVVKTYGDPYQYFRVP
jgi:RHS repeat-associated protein